MPLRYSQVSHIKVLAQLVCKWPSPHKISSHCLWRLLFPKIISAVSQRATSVQEPTAHSQQLPVPKQEHLHPHLHHRDQIHFFPLKFFNDFNFFEWGSTSCHNNRPIPIYHLRPWQFFSLSSLPQWPINLILFFFLNTFNGLCRFKV